MAIPGNGSAGEMRSAVAHRVGRALVPVFFVVAGIMVRTRSSRALHWEVPVPGAPLGLVHGGGTQFTARHRINARGRFPAALSGVN